MDNPITLEKKLLTCEDYHSMIKAGIISEDEKVELLNGELIIMSPIGPKHSGVITQVGYLLIDLLKEKALVTIQNPVTIPPNSEPEPDLTILKLRDDFYKGEHPKPKDVFFLIEVSDKTLEKDQTIKASIYAEGKIPIYWVINLQEEQLEVYSQPDSGKYKLRQIFLMEDTVELPGFGIEIKVKDIFR